MGDGERETRDETRKKERRKEDQRSVKDLLHLVCASDTHTQMMQSRGAKRNKTL